MDIKNAKEAIRAEYEKTYSQLLSIIKGKNIPESVLSPTDAKISSASSSNDIATLIMHKDTSGYFTEQIGRINSYKPATPLTPPADDDVDDDDDNDDVVIPRITKVVKLMKPQQQILTNKEEVEEYIQLLKKQLVSHIDNGEDVVIQ